ncbi:SusC/RagA family TonB-linked outer membrane protein [Costertonia aggregata]|uniref:SusC/RagA family TonB-linked outer membrane protein n=1 Tax=Costertonia aggregata TaxID=343403 RepID=A0A7H9AR71_9FLAO|nr:SusC/RagA family TonB-linked outer membrane protein [Costertonia aggregata]QLG45943.1 SusC/RagA family TonB-linked outer membrane protein [Costertonia aggregata]
MKSKLTWMLTPLLVLCMSFSSAQEKTISGNVTDQNGLPLPGVSIVVVGTSSGTQTDFDGNYAITADVGQVLRFSYIGQKTANRTVGASDTINLQMEEDAEALEEVVVVGYGTSTKQAFSGTAKTVTAEDIELKNFSNVTQALAGEAAGVTVINTTGQPGSTSTIRIRGFGSVNGNRAPLYVVDGVPLTTSFTDGDGDINNDSSLNAINPSDIKSTTILKDATATAIYGSRGANGVVLITTKSGSANENYIEVDVRTGINTQLIPRYETISSPEESIGLIWEAKRNRELLTGDGTGAVGDLAAANTFASDNLFGTVATSFLDPGYNLWDTPGANLIDPATGQVRSGVGRRYTPETFEEVAFNPAFRTEANLKMGGGSEKGRFYASVGYLDDQGFAIRTSFRRYNARLNVNSDVKDWLNLGANIGYTYSETVNNGQTVGSENVFEFANKTQPIFPVFLRDDDGNFVPDPIFGGNQLDYGSASGFRSRPNADNLNPVGSALFDFNGTDRHEIITSFNLTAKLAKGLTAESIFGAQYSNNVFKSISNQFYGTGVSNEGDLTQSERESITVNFLQLLRYQKEFGLHSFEALVAHESNYLKQSFNSVFKTKAIIPGGDQLDNYIVAPNQATGRSVARSLDSYFSQLNYNYDNKYFLTGSVRRDGSSRFANNKWGTFGSIGASWVVSNEDFLSNNDFLNFLKVKASWGRTGDEQGVPFFTGINTFLVTNVGGEFAVAPELFANPNLTWETAQQYQVGVEFGLGNFLDATVDYFIKDTDNLFFSRRNAPSTGVAIINVNDGELRNSGLEFDLTAHILKTEKASLDFTINGAFLGNELLTTPIDPETGEPAIINEGVGPGGHYAFAEGRSIFDFYMREYAGVDPEDGFPQWNRYFDDVNGNGTFDDGDTSIQSLTPFLAENPDANVVSEATKTYADATLKFVDESSIPVVQGAFRLNATIHRFNLSTQFTYSLGGTAYDGQYAELIHDNNGGILGTNRHVDVRNRWRQPGDITDVPLIADRVIPNITSRSTRFLTSTDFIALNNVVLGYTFSGDVLKQLGMSGLNMYVSGDNLFVKSARDGFIPFTSETGNSVRRLFPPLTTFTFGVKAKF